MTGTGASTCPVHRGALRIISKSDSIIPGVVIKVTAAML